MSSPTARTIVIVALALAVRSQPQLAAQSSPDTTLPTVSITSPAPGERVARNVSITATAADAVGVKSVTFTDGAVMGTDTRLP